MHDLLSLKNSSFSTTSPTLTIKMTLELYMEYNNGLSPLKTSLHSPNFKPLSIAPSGIRSHKFTQSISSIAFFIRYFSSIVSVDSSIHLGLFLFQTPGVFCGLFEHPIFIICREHPLFVICRFSSGTCWNTNTCWNKSFQIFGFNFMFSDSGDDHHNSVQQDTLEVNLKNVLSGIMAIVVGRNKDRSEDTVPEVTGSNVTFIGSEQNGDTYLHPSVYIPSAPPLLEPNGVNYNAYKEVLEAEPPEWLRDSSTLVCMQCNAPFTALTRGRHHCRFCEGIFCRACSKGRCLLPVKFRERNPQRVCDTCYDMLDPLQGVTLYKS